MATSETHLDDEQLALRALGEPLSSHLAEHLQQCPRCSAEIDQLSAVVSSARAITDQDQPHTPDRRVWESIRQELDLDVARVVADSAASDATTVTSLSSRRRWPTGLLVAASIFGVVAGGTLALGAVALVSDEPAPTPIASSVVATTSLAALPAHEGTGEAEIVQTATGQELVVDVSNLTTTDGFYEVWLIHPKTLEMVGLGALSGDTGRFAVPDGLDLSQYSLVDVSSEPFDGDPLHSTDSVVRGELTI